MSVRPVRLFAIAVALSCAIAALAARAAPIAGTDAGPVIGASADGVLIFKGIPYAAPPIGALRWRPPQPVQPWTQPRRRHEVRRRVSATGAARSRRRSRRHRRELSVSERLDQGARRQTSGHGVDSRRRVPSGLGFVTDLRRHAVRATRRRAGDAELSARPVRLLRASRACRREPSRTRKATTRLMDQAAALAWVKANIAGVRRRPRQRHGVRRIGRRRQRAASADVAESGRVCSRKRSSRAAAAIRSTGGSIRSAAERESLSDQGVAWAKSVGAGRRGGAARATAQQVLGDGQLSAGLGEVGPVIDGDWVPDDPGVLLRER